MGTAPQTGRIETLPALALDEPPPKIAASASARQRSAGNLDFMMLLSDVYQFKEGKHPRPTRRAERKTALCLRSAAAQVGRPSTRDLSFSIYRRLRIHRRDCGG